MPHLESARTGMSFVCLGLLVAFLAATPARATNGLSLTFSKDFSPSTIGSGSTSPKISASWK